MLRNFAEKIIGNEIKYSAGENNDMSREFDNKVVVITGGAHGIGKAIAESFLAEGANVTVIDVIDGTHYVGDISKKEVLEAFADEVLRKYGQVDILVNNAGITRDNLLMRMTEEEYDSVLDTNLKGAFNTMRYLSRFFLKQRSGKIINISSVSGVLGNAGQANYSASKAGLIGLTKSVARELASRGICVNAVAPGFVDTDMTKNMPEKAREAALGTIPMNRMGRPEDIAETVAFLAGSGSDYITGQVICVDGGMAI